MIASAAHASSPTRARAALAELFEIYWYPLYAYVRRTGHSAEEAEDLTQGFVASLLEREDFMGLRREQGRFRAFLLVAFRHFASNRRVHEQAQKRGGGRAILSLDGESAESRYQLEPVDRATPETAFDRRWALTLLDRALCAVRTEWAAIGKSEAFALLSPALTGELARGGYARIAEDLGATEASVRKSAERLRRQFAQEVRLAIAETVPETEVDDELRFLFKVLQT